MTLGEFIKTVNYELTDKHSLGYIDRFYDGLLSPRRMEVKSVLEVGMQRGLSMRLWRDYFTNADIYGIDVDDCPTANGQERMHPIYGDAYCQQTLDRLGGMEFDLMIDDGPHTPESWEFFCRHYLKMLRPGGIAVVEDIIDTSRTSGLLELIGKDKKTTVIHFPKVWIRGLDVIIVENVAP